MTTPDPQYSAPQQPMGPPPSQVPPQGYYAQQPGPMPGYGVPPRPAGQGLTLTGGLWSIIGLSLGGLLFIIGLIMTLVGDDLGRAWYVGNDFLNSGLIILGLALLGEVVAGALAKKDK